MFKFRHHLIRNTGVIIGLLKQLISEIQTQKKSAPGQKPQPVTPTRPTPEICGPTGSVTVYCNITGKSSHHRIYFSPSLFDDKNRSIQYVWFDPQRKCFVLTDAKDAGSARICAGVSPHIDNKKMTLQVFHAMSVTVAKSGLTKRKYPASVSLAGRKIFIQQ